MRSPLQKPHGEELAEVGLTASILLTRDEHVYLYASWAFIELVLGKWVLVLWKELDLVGLIKKLIYSSSILSSNALSGCSFPSLTTLQADHMAFLTCF